MCHTGGQHRQCRRLGCDAFGLCRAVGNGDADAAKVRVIPICMHAHAHAHLHLYAYAHTLPHMHTCTHVMHTPCSTQVHATKVVIMAASRWWGSDVGENNRGQTKAARCGSRRTRGRVCVWGHRRNVFLILPPPASVCKCQLPFHPGGLVPHAYLHACRRRGLRDALEFTLRATVSDDSGIVDAAVTAFDGAIADGSLVIVSSWLLLLLACVIFMSSVKVGLRV